MRRKALTATTPFSEETVAEEGDWCTHIKEALMHGQGKDIREPKDFTLIGNQLHHRIPGRILTTCLGEEEASRLIEEVHEKRVTEPSLV